MAKHYDKFTLDAESIVSDTEAVKAEVSDITISSTKKDEVSAVKKLKGIKIEYDRDGKVISSKPF